MNLLIILYLKFMPSKGNTKKHRKKISSFFLKRIRKMVIFATAFGVIAVKEE